MKIDCPIEVYVHREIASIPEETRPKGILKTDPAATLVAVLNRIASIEVYKTKMAKPKNHRGSWPPSQVIEEAEALNTIAAVIHLWLAGKLEETRKPPL